MTGGLNIQVVCDLGPVDCAHRRRPPRRAGRGTVRVLVLHGGNRTLWLECFHEVLARHEEVGIISNVEDRIPGAHHLPRWNNRLYRAVPPTLTTKGRLRFALSEAYRILDAEVSPALSRPFRDLTAEDLTPWLAQRLRAAFGARAARHRSPPSATSSPAGRVPGCSPRHSRVPASCTSSGTGGRWPTRSSRCRGGGYDRPTSWRYGPLPAEYQDAWAHSGRSFPVLAALTGRILRTPTSTPSRPPLPARG